MDSISFDNFRKFQHFPEITLAPINYIVGPNNSGKSTFIKAISLLQHNLNLNLPNFNIKIPFIQNISFWETGIEDYKWGDYASNLNYEAKSGIITFKWSIEEIDYTMDFGYENKFESLSEINPPVQSLQIDLFNTYFPSAIKYNKKENSNEWEVNSWLNLKSFQNWISKYEYVIENVLTQRNDGTDQFVEEGEEFDEESITMDKLPFSMDLFMKLISDDNEITINENFLEDLGYYLNLIKKSFDDLDINLLILFSFIMKFRGNNIIDYLEPIKESYKLSKGIHEHEKNKLDAFTLENYGIKKIIIDLYLQFSLFCANLINYKELFTLSNGLMLINAHGVSHDTVFQAKDKNNYLAQTVREFELYKNVSSKYEDAKAWINGWLVQFNIGDDFEIRNEYGGEIYSVWITKENNKIPLGRMGTGIIQIFILLLRICIARFKLTGNDETDIILIEEPEQNLHPSYQSKLTDLFLDIVNTGSLRLIIETHSEYLIRRTQVLVSEMKLTEENLEQQNPFKVYYFPSEGIPYDMKYRIDGCFANEFGTGFFDEASNLAFKLF